MKRRDDLASDAAIRADKQIAYSLAAWPLFQELRQSIADRMQRDDRMTLEHAYVCALLALYRVDPDRVIMAHIDVLAYDQAFLRALGIEP